MLLLHQFCKHINPLTAVGYSMLKDDLELKDPKEFGKDLKNTILGLRIAKLRLT